MDRVREDLDRLQQINDVLEAGARRDGEGFVRELNSKLRTRALRPRATIEIRTSQDVARLAADFVRSPRFPAFVGRASARVDRWLADVEGTRETTLLSRSAPCSRRG